MKVKSIACACLAVSIASHAVAFSWEDLWWRADQQAYKKFQQSKFDDAAAQFNNPYWQASSLYRSGEYQKAAHAFKQLPGIDAQYNLGNALAHAGDLEGALKAYDNVLAYDETHARAAHNKAVVQAMLEAQDTPEQQNDNDSQDDDQDANNSPQSDKTDNGQDQEKNGSQNNGETGQDETSQDKNEDPGDTLQHAGDHQQDDTPLPMQPLQADNNEGDAQALNAIPDDPGSLLRQKFLRDYLNRHRERATG